jgi:hypothetical protein
MSKKKDVLGGKRLSGRELREEKGDLRDLLKKNREVFVKNEASLRDFREDLGFMEEDFAIDVESVDIKLGEGLETLNPTFRFQESKRWRDLQERELRHSLVRKKKLFERGVRVLKDKIKELEEQQERILDHEKRAGDWLKSVGN